MIKVISGKKGVGKTRIMVDTANNLAATGSGDVVFIDGTSQLMYDLKHKVRFINLSEFPIRIDKACSFLGFICGVISEDYDITGMFIDDINRILNDDADNMKELFEGIDKISSRFNMDFYFSIEGDPDSMPEFIKAYF